MVLWQNSNFQQKFFQGIITSDFLTLLLIGLFVFRFPVPGIVVIFS